jgi:hypothetical protein
MTKPSPTDLVGGFSYAMETLAFVCVDVADGPAPAAPDEAIHCSIVCRGAAASFRLNVIAPVSLGRTVAANMLGADPAAPEAVSRASDSMREVMNVACGTICARLAESTSADVKLDLPQSSTDSDAAATWSTALGAGAIVIDADGSPVILWAEDVQ